MNLLEICSADEILYLLDVGRLTPERLLEQIGFEWPMREGDELVANTEDRFAWRYGVRVWECCIRIHVHCAPSVDDVVRWKKGTRLRAIVETYEFMKAKTYRGQRKTRRWNQSEFYFDAADKKPPAALVNYLCQHIAEGKNWSRVR
jgi:hypothetical protein